MPKGGARPGAGRKRTTPLPRVRRDVALEFLDVTNGVIERKDCSKECEKFLVLAEAGNDKRLQWDVLRYMKECVDGKPKQRNEEKIVFDPNAPLRVVVEHIGRRSV